MRWNVDPLILQWGPLALSWYGLFFAGGFLAGFKLMHWIYRREARDPKELESLLWYVLVGTLVGMRILHCLVYEPDYYLANPWEILQIWRGGYASHGGAIGLLLAVYLYSRGANRPRYLWLLDRLAIPAVLAGAFIRIGNFFNSEVFGEPTQSVMGVVFERIDALPRHPTQLYEAFAYLAIFVLLLAVYFRSYDRSTGRTQLRDGVLSGAYLVLVFAARAAIEVTKAPQAAYESDLPLSIGQFLSAPFIVAGLALLMRRARSID